MHNLLVIAPCAPEMLKSQGTMVAERMAESGKVKVELLTDARSGMGRVVDVMTRGFFKALKYDVIFVNVYGYKAFVYEAMAIFYGKLFRKRVVIMLRGGWMAEFFDNYPRIGRCFLSMPDAVLTPHGFLKKQLQARGVGIHGIIPNFIELQRYPYKKRACLEPKFLFMRGTHFIYNPEMALHAFQRIQKVFPSASMTLVGRDDDKAKELTALIAQLGLKNVKRIAPVPKDEVPRLASSHDVYIQTNRVDNMPVTVLEMWALGIPVVATNVGGLPDLVTDQQDAILVEKDDIDGFADACIGLLKNKALADKLSENGRMRVENMTWEKIAPLWENVFFNPEGDEAHLHHQNNIETIEEGEKI